MHTPAGYAIGIAGAAVVLYLMPPKLRLPVAGLAIVAGVLLLRGGVSGLKKDFGG